MKRLACLLATVAFAGVGAPAAAIAQDAGENMANAMGCNGAGADGTVMGNPGSACTQQGMGHDMTRGMDHAMHHAEGMGPGAVPYGPGPGAMGPYGGPGPWGGPGMPMMAGPGGPYGPGMGPMPGFFGPGPMPLREGGQSAFAAIQEVVMALMADPTTDWNTVDIEGLRQHLIDMDNVTLRADVQMEEAEGGQTYLVTSDDPRVEASIRSMVAAHVATMNGILGWSMTAEEIPGGMRMTVTGAEVARIRALGFIGIMALGAHHQAHHMAIARGQAPHG